MSKNNLQDFLKKEMGYSENLHQCLNCKFFSEKDLSGDMGNCNLNPALALSINIHGICSHWKTYKESEPKNNPKLAGSRKPVNGPDMIPKADLLKS